MVSYLLRESGWGAKSRGPAWCWHILQELCGPHLAECLVLTDSATGFQHGLRHGLVSQAASVCRR